MHNHGLGARHMRAADFPRKKLVSSIVLLAILGLIVGSYYYLHFHTMRNRISCRNISVADAKALIESIPSLVILDASTEKEYAQAHLKGAINIPASDLPNRVLELNSNSTILVYCQTGRRSAQACAVLVERGFTRVYNMEGGIVAWMNSGYPIITGTLVPFSRTSRHRLQ